MTIYACELPPEQMHPTARKKVLLWGPEGLLRISLERLLNTSEELELIHVSEELDAQAVIEQAQKIQPDVAIIPGIEFAGHKLLPLQLLEKSSSLKVIVINLQCNSLEIFNKQTVWINESTDLLSIVEGCPRLS